MRFARIGLLAAFALALTGCGAAKPAGSVPAGSEFAPASSAVYFAVNTGTSSAQWQKAGRLLDRFPGRAKVLASFNKDLAKNNLTWERDVKPALGDSIHVVLFDFKNNGNDFVGYTKPKDEAKFDKLLASGTGPLVHRKVDGWTVFAAKQAVIDRFEAARSAGSLSNETRFQQAMAKVPKDAAIRGYVNGESLQSQIDRAAGSSASTQGFRNFSQAYGKLASLSFSASAEAKGVAVDASFASSPAGNFGNYSPKLDGKLPAGALLYFSFGNLQDSFTQILDSVDKSVPNFQQQQKQFENALGFSLQSDLLPLFSKEGAFALYKGRPIPGIVFMLDVSGNENKAQTVLGRFGALAALGGGAQARTFNVNGVKAIEIKLKGFSIFGAVDHSTLVVSSTEALLRGALGSGSKLSDDAVYKDSRAAAGAPGEAVGSFYMNLKDGLPYVFDYAQSSGSTLTPDERANTETLQSIFFSAKRDGDRYSVSGFLAIQ